MAFDRLEVRGALPLAGLSQVTSWFLGSNKKNEKAVLSTALYKTRRNLVSGGESYPLTLAENICLYRNCPFKNTYWIDPEKIDLGLYWPEKKRHLIVYDGIINLFPLTQRVTSIFIKELIEQKRRVEETTLYNSMAIGVTRPVILRGERVRIPLNTHENMMIYFDKCQSLIRSIQERGIEWFKDENIGLAVTSEGRIAHYRVGKHRLAIAQALGIKRIPIDILLVSGKFLVEQVPWRRLWNNWAMVRAVDDVLHDAVATLGKG